MTTRLRARPLAAAALAPFGWVTSRPPPATAATRIAGLGGEANARPGRAVARLGWFVAPASRFPVRVGTMERHRFSSQGFVPCDPAAWLVLVAPDAPDGGPDMARALAFVADATQAVTLRAAVWHAPLTAFAPAAFAVLTHLADDADDDEIRELAESVTVLPPDPAP
jgi:ureidoglycolate lyase